MFASAVRSSHSAKPSQEVVSDILADCVRPVWELCLKRYPVRQQMNP